MLYSCLMNIAVVGAGYVGLVTGTCFAEFGVKILCVEKQADRIEKLQKGILPFYEPGLEELVKKNSKEGRLVFTEDLSRAVKESLVIFIAVGTPPRGDGSADLTAVEEVASNVARHLDSYKVIVTKSTVPVGTANRIKQIITETQKEGVPFDVASNPEFLREGAAIEDFLHPNRIVIGAESAQAIAILQDLYRPLYLIETPFVITDIATAEMIKLASNAFLATKITFINDIANICERVGADVHVVAKGIGLDRRIGPKFLHPGPGFGGACLPKDVRALHQMAAAAGYESEVLGTILRVNTRQQEIMIEKIKGIVGDLSGKTLGVLGLSFKPNTSDVRESPSCAIIQRLQEEGAIIHAHDPAAMEEAARVLSGVTFCQDPYEAATGAEALILLTEWNEFRNMDLERIKGLLTRPLFIDLRNVYEPSRLIRLGFQYMAVGRHIRL